MCAWDRAGSTMFMDKGIFSGSVRTLKLAPGKTKAVLYTPAAVGKRENNGHCSVVNALDFCLTSIIG